MADNNEGLLRRYPPDSCEDDDICDKGSKQELGDRAECECSLFRGVEERNHYENEDRG